MENVRFKYEGKNKSKKGILILTQECTIYNIQSIYKYLSGQLEKKEIHKVVVEQVSNIDLAGVQMIIALKKLLKSKNENLEFEMKLDEDLKNIITHCGIHDILLT